MAQPTAVEYARHYGLSFNHHTIFEEDFASAIQYTTCQARVRACDNADEQPSSAVYDRGYRSQTAVHEQKLCLTSKQVSSLLRLVESPLSYLGLDRVSSWRELLPDHQQQRRLYLGLPLLQANYERDSQNRAQKEINLLRILKQFKETQSIQASAATENGHKGAYISGSWNRVSQVFGSKIEKERLEIGVYALRSLQDFVERCTSNEVIAELVRNDLLPRLREKESSPPAVMGLTDFVNHDRRGDSGLKPLLEATEAENLLQSPCDEDGDEDEGYQEEISDRRCVSQDILHEAFQGVGLQKRVSNSFGGSLKRRRLSHGHCHIPEPNCEELQLATIRRSVGHEQATSHTITNITKAKIQYESPLPSVLGGDISDSTAYALSLPKSLHESIMDTPLQSQITSNRVAITPLQNIHQSLFRESRTSILSQALESVALRAGIDFVTAEEPRHSFANKPGVLAENDMIDGSETCFRDVVSKFEKPVSSESFLWKTDGNKILDSDEDDDNHLKDNISPHNYFEVESCMNVMEHSLITLAKPVESHQLHVRILPAQTAQGSVKSPIHTRREVCSRDNVHHNQRDLFSTSTSLSSFLALRGKKFLGKNYPNQSKTELEEDPIESTQRSIFGHASAQDEESKTNTSPNHGSVLVPQELVWPEHETLMQPTTIIINNTLLQSHPELVKLCECNVGDTLEIIYRDFTSIDRGHPDIILTPVSCLVISNVQQFSQCSLPGEKRSATLSSAKNRITSLYHGFDHIVILVAVPDLTSAKELTEVAAFCTSLQHGTTIQVRPVFIHFTTPDDLKNAIKAWTWKIIANYSQPSLNQGLNNHKYIRQLIQDVTVWEVFLRRAGMNVMAAQLMLSSLKNLESNQSDVAINMKPQGSSRVGLQQFMYMSLNVRLKLFGDIVGNRATQNVSSVIDYERSL